MIRTSIGPDLIDLLKEMTRENSVSYAEACDRIDGQPYLCFFVSQGRLTTGVSRFYLLARFRARFKWNRGVSG